MTTEMNFTTMLGKLAENETALARLYNTYSELFPKKRRFWTSLANEENGHAQMIKQAAETALDSAETRDLNLDVEIIQISLDYIADKQLQAENGDINSKEAVKVALEIETGILERGSFDFLAGRQVPDFDELFAELVTDTRQHSEKIRAELNKKRWGIF
jgi:hypothetical protein